MFKEGSSLKITHEMFGLNSEDLILAPGLIINIIPFWAMNPFLLFLTLNAKANANLRRM